MTSEALARTDIDKQLQLSGWAMQDYAAINLGASLGVALREFPVKVGRADYLLFLDRTAVGVIEAKKAGMTLSGVAEQSALYVSSLSNVMPHAGDPLPFCYESTGVETFFRDLRDPEPRSSPAATADLRQDSPASRLSTTASTCARLAWHPTVAHIGHNATTVRRSDLRQRAMRIHAPIPFRYSTPLECTAPPEVGHRG